MAQCGAGKILDHRTMALPSSALRLSYLALLRALIVFTNVRLCNIASVVALPSMAFISVLIAWLDWWGVIGRLLS
jgi:hypothetical protein